MKDAVILLVVIAVCPIFGQRWYKDQNRGWHRPGSHGAHGPLWNHRPYHYERPPHNFEDYGSREIGSNPVDFESGSGPRDIGSSPGGNGFGPGNIGSNPGDIGSSPGDNGFGPGDIGSSLGDTALLPGGIDPDSRENDFNQGGEDLPLRGRPPSSVTMGAQPQNKDAFRACVRSCFVTPEYNPVCGTNGVTYNNHGRLLCAQQCGADVQIAKQSACSAPVAKNDSRSVIEACIANCPITQDFSPVCGTNNITYANPVRLQCVRNCGVAVSVEKYDPCYRFPNPEDPIVNIELAACQQSCPITSGAQNVCGSDGRNYNNPQALHCARKCGINVTIKKHGKCQHNNGNVIPNKVVDPTTAEPPSVATEEIPLTPIPDKTIDPQKDNGRRKPSAAEVMACTQRCPLTSEYLPICGTDGITYTNPGRLLCSQFCGIDVNVKKFAPCESDSKVTFTNCPGFPKIPDGTNFRPTTSVEECLSSCSTSEAYNPVCGTNDITYQNIEKLLCAKRCGIDVCVKKQSACDNYVTTQPDIITRKPDTVSSTEANTPVTPTKAPIDKDSDHDDKDKSTTGFTIDPDVLHSLFPDDDNSKGVTEEYLVDERFNDNIDKAPATPAKLKDEDVDRSVFQR